VDARKYEASVATWSEANQLAERLDADRERCISEFALGLGYLGLGDENGRQWTSASIERSRSIGFPWAEGFALTVDGMLCTLIDDTDSARSQFVTALEIQHQIGDEEGAGMSLGGLAALAARGGEFENALDLYGQSLRSFKACGDRGEEARILSEMGWTALEGGDIDLARRRFLESVGAHTDVASVRGVGIALIGLAAAEAVEERFENAVVAVAAADLFVHQEGIAVVYYDETPAKS